jgi:hypothetical protein
VNRNSKEPENKNGIQYKENPPESGTESPKRQIHPLKVAADKLLNGIRDTEECVIEYVPLAEKRHVTALYELVSKLELLRDRVQQRVTGDRGPLYRELYEAVLRFDRLGHSRPGSVLREALLLNLFSAFDAFVGDLIGVLFCKKPELFFKLQGEVKVGDVIKAVDLPEFKEQLLNDYIDDMRRKSYIDQFDTLATFFDLSTLKQFEAWPEFVEISQRRNLVAHNASMVSQQYLRICKKANVNIDPSLKVGDRLQLTEEYLKKACRVVMEVGLKLVQTIWRKTLPDELEEADTHLNRVAYDALQLKEWDWAKTIGQYALGLPRTSTERNRLIAVINLAIALKFGGDDAASRRLIEQTDWSAKIPEFKLAVAVLHDDFDEASKWMISIGKRGEILREEDYHTWPLFRDFRASPQFMATYESVYGYSFRQELIPQEPVEAAAVDAISVDDPKPESPKAKEDNNDERVDDC